MNLSTKTLFLVIFVTLSVLLVPISSQTVAYAKFDGKVKGIVKFVFFSGKKDVLINAVVEKGLESGIVYPYHIHEFPIKDGNCTSAGGHLDPTGRGKVVGYVCDPQKPDECEVGDLSGKYGGLKPDEHGYVNQDARDPYVKLEGPSGVTDRSVVIHLPDAAKTRYDCANIVVAHPKRHQLY